MEFTALEPWKLIALMATGGIFAFCGLWLTFRSKSDGHSAKIELFGLKFESTSAGLLVFLIGATFLASPVYLPAAAERPDGEEDVDSRQDVRATGDDLLSADAPDDPTDWQQIGLDTFSDDEIDWYTGSLSSDAMPRADFSVASGDYRWDIEFAAPQVRGIDAPYGPARNFYLATDIEFVSGFDERSAAMGLVFGIAGEREFRFLVTAADPPEFALHRRDAPAVPPTVLISWTPIPAAVGTPARLSVVVRDGVVQMYINDRFVGDHELPTFTGGKVGLAVYGYEPGTLVFDFDNVDYRRAP